MADRDSKKTATLYDRIGGSDAVENLVGAFYKRVLADPELLPFFEHTSTEKLEHMQKEFFAAALDGPVSYTGRSMSEAHHGLGIKPRHLARFLDHLLDTLKDKGLSEDDTYSVISRINTYADEITGSSSVDG